MSGLSSQPLLSHYIDGEIRFDLPVRPLGALRWVGVAIIGFGVLFAWSPAVDLWETTSRWPERGPDGAQALFALFQLTFVLAGCVPVLLGTLILAGRCQIGWKPGELRSTECLGPLRWTRRMPREPIRSLAVIAPTSRSSASAPRELTGFAVLMAVFANGTRNVLVLGYPKDLLLRLAEQLKGYVGSGVGSAASGDVEIVEESPRDEDQDVTEQPADSAVRVEGDGANLRLVIPPAGIQRGSRGLFWLATAWCMLMFVITAVFVLVGGEDQSVPWFVWLFILVFWLIGLGLLAGAINMGRRRAVFTIGDGRLRVRTSGLFGSKDLEWRHGELARLRVGASGMEVNGEPVLELQIQPRTGKRVGVLAGRDETELRWMATRLRRALNLPSRAETMHSR